MNKVKFGYKDISQKEKPKKVNEVFTSVSNRYDLMNDIMSFGLHRLWKKQFIRLCDLDRKKYVLDVACGTGDISLDIAQTNNEIKLTCLDPNNEMLEICKQKLMNKGFIDIEYLDHGIEQLLERDCKYDLITLAFGFRNFSNHEQSLINMYNCLKPGGSLLIMDFKRPRNKIFSKLFNLYTLKVIPSIGKVIANDEESYRYLGESIQTYFSPNEIRDMCIYAGFEDIKIINLLEDVATIHIAKKA
tara:strand:- start:3652 stop:4386 length:735 start_codon:yes stop_codon:yes gene_type:complete